MRIPIFGTGVASGKKQVTVRKTVGMYWEPRGETEKSPIVAVPFPGTAESATTMPGDETTSLRLISRNFASIPLLLVVAGKTVYTVAPETPTTTSIGDITGPSTGLPRIAVGTGQNFFIVDGIGSWFWNGATYTSVGEVFDDCTWIGGYWVAAQQTDAGVFYISTNGTTWTDFATAEAMPDGVVAVAATQNELFIFGQTSIEVWAHTGNSDFPFERISGATSNIGCISRRSVVKVGGVLYFAARSDDGMPFIARMNGYAPERVSTDDIDRLLPDLYRTATAFDACGFVWYGHPMYMISDSSAGWTMYYDAMTGAWGSVTDSTRNKIVLGVEYSGRVYGVSAVTGDRKIYRLDATTHNLPKRQIITDHVVSPDGERFTADSLRLDIATNVGASEKSVSLKVSRDGGLTWGSTATAGIGVSTDPIKKVEFRRLGAARSFTFDLTFPADVDITVSSASLNARD